MRENRPYGLEGGETGSNGLPYPYADCLTHERAEHNAPEIVEPGRETA